MRFSRIPPSSVFRPPASNPRSGQTVVFLLLAFTALVFLLLSNVDLHRVIQVKDQAQNAGDAAALAAARWQGATLNLVGELNLLHVLALASQSPAAVDAITNMQARLCFSGPVTALLAAQIAAKNNHTFAASDAGLAELLNFHLALVKASPPPWSDIANDTDAWTEYEKMLRLVTDDKLAAIPDDIPLYAGPSSDHPLLRKAFYEAIEGRNWCWFFLFAHGLLDSYDGFTYWQSHPLPEPDASDAADIIFDLGLSSYTTPLRHLFSATELAALVNDANLGPVSAAALASNTVMDAVETWYVFDPKSWTAWERIAPDGENAFPIAGAIRPEYDYSGADVVVGVSARVDLMPLGAGSRNNQVAWTAAAKPFGYLEAGSEKQRPDSAASFVLPAFRDVRLIPVDAAAGSENNSSDLAWVEHVTKHLKPYLDIGPKTSDCRFCQALAVWEVPAFRQEGIGWLSTNSASCHIPTSGGGHRGGGTRRGH